MNGRGDAEESGGLIEDPVVIALALVGSGGLRYVGRVQKCGPLSEAQINWNGERCADCGRVVVGGWCTCEPIDAADRVPPCSCTPFVNRVWS